MKSAATANPIQGGGQHLVKKKDETNRADEPF